MNAKRKEVFVRAPYNYDADEVSRDTGLACADASRAVQAEAEDADINTIVRRFGITGELPIVNRIPLNVDFDEILDYRTCLDAVRNAERSFDSLPANVRARFANDPTQFVEFCENPANVDEAVALGVLKKPPVADAVPPGQPIGSPAGAT